MFIVTGGAGFIGSNLVAHLEERGLGPVTIVDDAENDHKMRNIAKRHAQRVPPEYLTAHLAEIGGDVRGVFHLGALTSTTERDVRVARARRAASLLLPEGQPAETVAFLALGYPAYWLSFDPQTHARHARMIRDAEARGAPLTVDDLATHECVVGFDRGVTPATTWPTPTGARVRVQGRLVANDLQLRVEACLRGQGIALLPDVAVRGALREGALVEVRAAVTVSGSPRAWHQRTTSETSSALRGRKRPSARPRTLLASER
jgi:hypothetical protein